MKSHEDFQLEVLLYFIHDYFLKKKHKYSILNDKSDFKSDLRTVVIQDFFFVCFVFKIEERN